MHIARSIYFFAMLRCSRRRAACDLSNAARHRYLYNFASHPYSYLSALTGSSRAAKYAGISAANEQMRKALMQIIATSLGITSAGIAEN